MPFSSRAMQAADWLEIHNFTPIEFKNPERMGYEFMKWLDRVRVNADVPMHVSSSYRSPEYNKSVGGASDSAHTDDICDAVDIRMAPRPDDPNWNYSRWQIVMAARDLGCRRFGSYANGSLHIDRTEDRRPAPRFWIMVAGHPTI